MHKDKKVETVAELTELFSTVEAIVLADASGVDANSINELRSECRKEGVTFRIIKNTLAKRALVGTDKEILADSFRGPTAIALKPGDPVTPAKLTVGFAKDSKTFEIKGGFLSGSVLDVDGVESLSKMKGLDELRSEILSVFKAPQQQFVGVCNTMVTQVVSLLSVRANDLEEKAA